MKVTSMGVTDILQKGIGPYNLAISLQLYLDALYTIAELLPVK